MDQKELLGMLNQFDSRLFSQFEEAQLSFPKDGHQVCFSLEDSSFWFKHRNDILSKVIARFPPPTGLMLDIGGGNGFTTRRLLDDGIPVVLLEPGKQGAWNAKTHRKIPWVIRSSLQQSEIPEQTFTAAGCFDVLEHVEDDAGFVRSISRILKSGGMLYLTVPAEMFLWSDNDLQSGHFRRYNSDMLLDILGQDFEPIYFTHFFGCLTLPVYLFRTVPSLFSGNKNNKVFSREVEHGAENKFISRTMRGLLAKELRMVRRGRSKKWGTSCLMVARRK